MKILQISFISLLFIVVSSYSKNIYFINFTDKGDVSAQLASPENYLSQRAIIRRNSQNIAIDESDVPVKKSNIDFLESKGIEVRYSSKWENGVIAEMESYNEANVAGLDFVSKVKLIKKRWNSSASCVLQEEKNCFLNFNKRADFGEASTQAEMLNAHTMHDNGYTGEGKIIAVFDVGFRSVDNLSQFAHLFSGDQILSVWNYPDDNNNVYIDSDHGTGVLSIMAAKNDGKTFGIAPNAQYMLAITEDGEGEYIVEEYYWLVAAEWADSSGADIINSSLVYKGFSNPVDDYGGKSGLNGNSSVITNAADKAASKGMIVVCSAGNYGNNSWKTFGFPADGDSVLTVGAVDASENLASLSSTGPTADGRIKPDVVAMGSGVSVVSYNGLINKSSGTSLSSPLIAGFAACLWQSMSSLTNMELIGKIKSIATNRDNPNSEIGYGIPKYDPQIVSSIEKIETSKQATRMNLISRVIYLNHKANKLRIYSTNGKLVARGKNCSSIKLNNLAPGNYVINASFNDYELSEKVCLR